MYLGRVLARTKNLTLDRSHSARLLRRWSTRRPGVATTTCGRLSSSMACAIISIPPTMTAVRTLSGEPSTANCSAIWNASSLQLLRKLHETPKKGAIPCWSEHKCKDTVGVYRKFLQYRERKRDGLSGTCLCVSYTVSALQNSHRQRGSSTPSNNQGTCKKWGYARPLYLGWCVNGHLRHCRE